MPLALVPMTSKAQGYHIQTKWSKWSQIFYVPSFIFQAMLLMKWNIWSSARGGMINSRKVGEGIWEPSRWKLTGWKSTGWNGWTRRAPYLPSRHSPYLNQRSRAESMWTISTTLTLDSSPKHQRRRESNTEKVWWDILDWLFEKL